MHQGESLLPPGFQVALRYLASKLPHTANYADSFGNADGSPRIQQIEHMRALQAIVIGWEHEVRLQEPLAFIFKQRKERK